MTLCGDCRFWIRGGGDMKIPAEFGACQSFAFKTGYHVSFGEMASDEVLVEDDEGWGFFTGEKFGCVHGRMPDEA